MIATDMAKSGRFTFADIERGICEASPNLESRKAGHIEEYARRMAEKAWRAPEVQAHRQERQAQRDRARMEPLRLPPARQGEGAMCRRGLGGSA